MKLKLIIALLAGAWCLLPVESNKLFAAFGAKTADFLYDREIRVVGNHALTAEYFTERFPKTISNAALLVTDRGALDQFQRHPLIQKISLSRCHTTSFDCLIINVTERSGRYVAALADNAQLLGNDGRVITNIKKELIGGHLQPDGISIPTLQVLLPQDREAIPLVLGLDRYSESPDALQQGFRLASTVLDILEESSHSQVSVLSFKNDGLLEARFSGLIPPVTFTLGETNQKALQETLGRQVDRLQRVRQAVGETMHSVQKIDVGFNTQTVVSLINGASFDEKPAPKQAPVRARMKPPTPVNNSRGNRVY